MVQHKVKKHFEQCVRAFLEAVSLEVGGIAGTRPHDRLRQQQNRSLHVTITGHNSLEERPLEAHIVDDYSTGGRRVLANRRKEGKTVDPH